MDEDHTYFSVNEILIDILYLLCSIAHHQKDLNSSDHRKIDKVKNKYDNVN